MDGILIIDKPAGITSHDVVARVRRILKTKRVGHTGTLDPFATGVMVVLVGQATRLAQFLDKDAKSYEAVVRFGSETDTGDRTGLRIADCGLRDEELAEALAAVEWNQTLDNFRGEIEQIPPMFSAKKVAGKRLYEHARRGEVIERKPVKIRIDELEMLSGEGFARVMRVTCSAGTYIRTLAADIGRAIGLGAHLTELRRTAAGMFLIADSITLDDFAALEDPRFQIRPKENAVSHLKVFNLPPDRVSATRNGLTTRITTSAYSDGEPISLLGVDGQLIAIGIYSKAEKMLRPKIVMV